MPNIYYVFDDNLCKAESMTKEEILAAITQAVESHEISDVDTGFVTTLKEQNSNTALKFWVGTTAQYNAIAQKDSNCFYIVTDDSELDDLESEIANITRLQMAQADLKNRIILEETVTNGNGKTVDLDAGHNISEYSMVKVLVSGFKEVLCNVYWDGTNTVRITGTGTDDLNAGASSTTIITVNLWCNKENNQLTSNQTKETVISESSCSITTKSILRIKGVY